jgi:hypothetical protein
MNDKELERSLRALGDEPAPPGLRARLEQAIPDRFHERGARRVWAIGGGLAAAAAAAWVVMAALGLDRARPVYAEVLRRIARASDQARAVHVVMRTLGRPGEDFSYVNLGGELQRVEVWIEAPRAPGEPGRMRVEKADRVYCFDGKSSTAYLPPRHEAFHLKAESIDTRLLWPAEWVERLLRAPGGQTRLVSLHESADAGRLVIHEAAADVRGMKPAFFEDFERETEILWDRQSQRLTGFRRFVYANGKRTLFSDVVSIEYPSSLADPIFQLALGPDVRWGGVAEAPPEVASLGPGEVARRFWQAAIDGDWETLRLYCPSPSMIDWLRENRPTRLLRLGEAFRSGLYPGYFVPYRVEFRSGQRTWVKEYNLALRNDTNPQRRYVFDGGI